MLDHLAEQGSAAQLEEGLDGQPLRCHALVEGIAVAHAPLSQQKLLPGQFLKRDFRLPGQWVPGGGHHADGLRLIHSQHKAGLQQRLVQRVSQVDLIGAQHLEHLIVGGGAEHQLHLRAEGVIPLQQVGQKGAADRICQCHPQGAADLPGRLQGRFGLLGCGQQGAGIGQKGLPGIGQADRFAHPVEERRFQFGFQLGHLRGDCRLGIPQLPCRTGKAVQLRNMQKGVDGTQFHGGTSQRRVMPVTVRTAPSTTKWTSNPENSIPYTRSGSCW